MFINEYPNIILDLHLKTILELFITFEVRMIEQNLISYYNPALNRLNKVKFGLKFIPRNKKIALETIKYKIDVLAFSLANKLITSFTSINSASIGLGISRTTLSRNINTGIPVFSSILKWNIILNSKAKLSNKNNILLCTSKLNNKFAEITGIDRYKFSTELVTAIKKDKMTIHSTYLNPFEIWNKLGFKSKSGVYNYLNKERLIYLNGEQVYLITHPNYTSSLLRIKSKNKILPKTDKAIYLVDIINNTAILFKQVKLLLQHLNINDKNYSAINNYLSKGKLYKDRFKFIYATESKDDVIKGLTILQKK